MKVSREISIYNNLGGTYRGETYGGIEFVRCD